HLNLMRTTITIIFSLCAILLSCKKESKSTDVLTTSHKEEAQNPKQEMSKMKTSVLTKAQFHDFFPDYIGSHKQYNIYVAAPEAMATASYGDFDNTFTYSLTDGAKKPAVLKNFENSYASQLKGPDGTHYIKKERDGHKTIAFLQPKINRYLIEFIYNNRFKLSIEGSEHPDALWSYIKKEDLQKLDTY
ncbi:MAG: hypothetical protein KDC68_09015, partial [Gelidibacter sp.]|nr:hypothetical protein [Gelidibacter sp.]